MITQYCETENLDNFMLAIKSSQHESARFSPAFPNFDHEIRILVSRSDGRSDTDSVADGPYVTPEQHSYRMSKQEIEPVI